MNIVLQINGGIGKSVASTGVVRAIKDKYPESQLIVISAYPEVFLNNHFVDRCFGPMNYPYFYEKFIHGQEIVLMLHDPYLETGHILNEEHLIQSWCKLNGLETWYGPEIYLTQREIDFYTNKFYSEKPIFLLQTSGGAVGQENKYSWARDIPKSVAERIINEFREEYAIVHVRREDQIPLDYTIPVHDSFRAICVLAAISEKRLLIDSFIQHACAALNLPATVCWVVNKPEVFGYNIHNNISPNPFTRPYDYKNSYYSPFDILGNPDEFPYNHEGEIFNVDAIIQSLKK